MGTRPELEIVNGELAGRRFKVPDGGLRLGRSSFNDIHIADEELRLLREQIDHLDKQILQLVAARTDVSLQIAHVKARENLAVFQPRRWDELLNHRTSIAAQLGLDTEFVKELFEKIHAESVRVQEHEMGVKEHK